MPVEPLPGLGWFSGIAVNDKHEVILVGEAEKI